MHQQTDGRSRIIAAAAILGTALLTVPSAAADPIPAGTVSVQSACYVNTARSAAQVLISGTGWEAGSAITISDKLAKLTATATASTSGTFAVSVPAPLVDSYSQSTVSDAIIASYSPDPAQPTTPTGPTATSATFLTTNFVVLQSGNRTVAHDRSTFRLSGFPTGRTIYAHYLSASGRLLGTVDFGRASGPCGLATRTRVLDPLHSPRRGRDVIQFDESRAYRRATMPQYRLALHIARL